MWRKRQRSSWWVRELRRPANIRLAILAVIAVAMPLLPWWSPPQPHSQAPTYASRYDTSYPECRGCGCAGGTGYRGSDGQCVRAADLRRVCGAEPTQLCRFENHPNAGQNRDAAVARGWRAWY